MFSRERLLALLEVGGIYAGVVLLLIIGCFVSPEFLTAGNQLNILNGVALHGIVACGMAFITYAGSMADLSLPSVMAFSGIITVGALPYGLPVAIALGVLAGVAIGVMNGLVVGKLNANPILWTLSVAFFMEGFMRFAWSGHQLYPDVTPGTTGAHFVSIFRLQAGHVPVIVLVMLAMFALAHFLLMFTRFGRESRLAGSSRATARASGIPVERVVFWNFVLAALAASVAGVFITSQNEYGVYYLGQGYDFSAVTAVVLGGVMLSGGRGTMLGVLGGVLVIGLLTNIMNFVGINSEQQDIITGCVFVAVVALQQYQFRVRGKDFA